MKQFKVENKPFSTHLSGWDMSNFPNMIRARTMFIKGSEVAFSNPKSIFKGAGRLQTLFNTKLQIPNCMTCNFPTNISKCKDFEQNVLHCQQKCQVQLKNYRDGTQLSKDLHRTIRNSKISLAITNNQSGSK